MNLDHLAIIDWDLGIRLAGNKKDLAEDMLSLFINELPAEIIKINEAAVAQNYSELLKHVHKLHGAVCYCGLPRLKTLLSHLETELKNNIMINHSSHLMQLNIEVTLLLERYSHHIS